MNKQKIKEDLKKIGNEIIDDLELVIKKGVSNIFTFFKDVTDESITNIFEKRKKINNKKQGDHE
jgi:hypothetical protein